MLRTGLNSAPSISLDVVIFTISEDALCVVGQRRTEAPLKGRLQLPGAALADSERLDDQVSEVVSDWFGLTSAGPQMRQFGTYGAARRDPRGPVLSIAWWTALPRERVEQGDFRIVPVAEIDSARLAFDHARLVRDALDDLADRVQFTNAATLLCQDPFTMAELRRVFEIVWEVDLDPANFHRKASSVEGLLEPTGKQSVGGPGRPAVLYRAGPLTRLSTPIVRPR